MLAAVKPYITLFRPQHWLKNTLVFVPLLYARNLTNVALLLRVLKCFAVFCALSSAIYGINDIFDAENDRRHPVKRRRPVASGQISPGRAGVCAAALFIAGMAVAVFGFGEYTAAIYALAYALLNVAYSLKFKHYAIVDCFCIAAGFVLRIFAGGAASGDKISEWLFLTMTALSLFMAFGKRRGEKIQVRDTADTRTVLTDYEPGFLDGAVFLCAGLTVVFYALWAISSASPMIYTVPLVIFLICKYLLIIHRPSSHGDPVAVILGDKSLLAAAGVFGLLSIALLYR